MQDPVKKKKLSDTECKYIYKIVNVIKVVEIMKKKQFLYTNPASCEIKSCDGYNFFSKDGQVYKL